jgi:four helix bundle protein
MSKAPVRTFKDLVVWQKAFDLSVEIYRLSSELPKHEFYGLASELRKTSRSIPYNIAEGYKRWSTVEYIRFLRISAGSAAELETQLMLAARLEYFHPNSYQQIAGKIAEAVRMLDALIHSLTAKLKLNQ